MVKESGIGGGRAGVDAVGGDVNGGRSRRGRRGRAGVGRLR
jgi:hypothetical protein